MLNYIRAEFYKLVHRPYTFVVLGVMLALEALLVAGHAFHNAHSYTTPFGGAIIMVVEFGTIGFCLCLLTADIVFAGQYKSSTLKNEVSFGLSRTRIYLGKLIAQTLLSVAYLVVMIGFYVGMCAIFLPIEPIDVGGFYNTTAVNGLIIVGYFLAVGIPLWIGAQAAACMCQFLIQGDMASSIVYMVIIFALEGVLAVIGVLIQGNAGEMLLKICEYLPRPILEGAKAVVGDWAYLGRAWGVGMFWTAACTAVGLYGFGRKEIK